MCVHVGVGVYCDVRIDHHRSAKGTNKVVSFSLRGKEIFRFALADLPFIHQWPTLPAPRTRPGTRVTLVVRLPDPPLGQERVAHARSRHRRASQPRTRESDPPVSAHVLYSQYRLGLVASRFDARARKRHDGAARPVRVRAGDKQLLGGAGRGGKHVQDAHDARARDEKHRREAHAEREVAQAETGALPGGS